jgi:hypothetical protein
MRRWEDNLIMYRNEIGLKGVDWIQLAIYEDKWLFLFENGIEILGSINSWNILT